MRSILHELPVDGVLKQEATVRASVSVSFVDRLLFETDKRWYLNDFYRWLEYDKPVERRRFGRSIGQLQGLAESTDLDKAGIWILPMTWNYYVDHGKVRLVRNIVNEGMQKGKRVIAFSTGDFTANVPFEGLTIFEASVYRSRNTGAQAMPVFIEDYLEKYFDGKLVLREKQSKPVVGFCGQASSGRLSEIARSARLCIQRAAWKIGARKWEPATVEHTALRSRVLESLARSPLVQTNFVLRKKYKGGDATGDNNDLKAKFVRNIVESDYTVCVRGTGNFSTRFYETLCLGRIPVFVNTDCKLPLDDTIDWKKYCVWVEEDEINRIDDKVRLFHERLSDADFKNFQQSCLTLWKNRLRRGSFYDHFVEVVNLCK